MSEKKKSVKELGTATLKVLEAYTRDVGKGIIRIDYAAMDAIGVTTGDIVKLRASKTTVAKVLPLYPTDEGLGNARFDGLVRNNAGVAIGDVVTIEKIIAPPAAAITVCWAENAGIHPTIDERYIADALEAVPVMLGDTLMVPYFGGRLTFKVLKMAPETAGAVQHLTAFTIVETEAEVKEKVFYNEYQYIIGAVNLNNFLRVEAVRNAGKEQTIYQRWKVEKWLSLYSSPGSGEVVAIVSRQVMETVENAKTD